MCQGYCTGNCDDCKCHKEVKIVKAGVINICPNCKTEHNGDLICPTCGQKLSQ